MKTPHKDAELLSAIANGEQMQRKNDDEWIDCSAEAALYRLALGMTTRIKPEPEPDVVQFYRIDVNCNNYAVTDERGTYDNLRLTFDGETRKLKSAEVL